MRHRAYLSREPIVTRALLAQCKPASWQQGAICKRDTRSVELIIANYIIRTPHPTQERCDQITALLDAEWHCTYDTAAAARDAAL